MLSNYPGVRYGHKTLPDGPMSSDRGAVTPGVVKRCSLTCCKILSCSTSRGLRATAQRRRAKPLASTGRGEAGPDRGVRPCWSPDRPTDPLDLVMLAPLRALQMGRKGPQQKAETGMFGTIRYDTIRYGIVRYNTVTEFSII